MPVSVLHTSTHQQRNYTSAAQHQNNKTVSKIPVVVLSYPYSELLAVHITTDAGAS